MPFTPFIPNTIPGTWHNISLHNLLNYEQSNCPTSHEAVSSEVNYLSQLQVKWQSQDNPQIYATQSLCSIIHDTSWATGSTEPAGSSPGVCTINPMLAASNSVFSETLSCVHPCLETNSYTEVPFSRTSGLHSDSAQRMLKAATLMMETQSLNTPEAPRTMGHTHIHRMKKTQWDLWAGSYVFISWEQGWGTRSSGLSEAISPKF